MRNGRPSNQSPVTSRREFLSATAAGAAWVLGPAGMASVRSAAKKQSILRWRAHEVAKIPNGYQVAVADVNGDGRPDILGLSSAENIVAWWENPSWRGRSITTQTHKNISLAPLFRPGHAARGVALASEFALEDSQSGGEIWWATPKSGADEEWLLRHIGQIPTSHRLRWANLDGSGRWALVNAPLLGIGSEAPEYKVGAPLTWYEIPEALERGHASAADEKETDWASHLIDDSLTVMHGICIMDWDGDGRDEILTASFEGVHLFKSTGKIPELKWSKNRLGEGDQASRPRRGSSEVAVGTVHGRRFISTIEPWHGEQVVVYFEARPGELWRRQVIDDSFHDGHALAVADFDGDGNDEIAAGYRGQGTSLHVYRAADSTGAKWERQTLATNMAAACLAVRDINGDGRPDLVAIGASTGNITWYENLGL